MLPSPPSRLLQLQCRRVDAVADAGRSRAVREEVPEVPAARRAHDLGADHPVTAVGLLVHRLAATIGAAARAAPVRSRVVPCEEIIGHGKFPYVGSSQPMFRYRLVLGAVAVPPAYLRQVVATHHSPWAYWRKAGLVVRASGAT